MEPETIVFLAENDAVIIVWFQFFMVVNKSMTQFIPEEKAPVHFNPIPHLFLCFITNYTKKRSNTSNNFEDMPIVLLNFVDYFVAVETLVLNQLFYIPQIYFVNRV